MGNPTEVILPVKRARYATFLHDTLSYSYRSHLSSLTSPSQDDLSVTTVEVIDAKAAEFVNGPAVGGSTSLDSAEGVTLQK